MKPLKVLGLCFEPKIVKIHRIAHNMAKNFCTEAGFFQSSRVWCLAALRCRLNAEFLQSASSLSVSVSVCPLGTAETRVKTILGSGTANLIDGQFVNAQNRQFLVSDLIIV